MQNLIFSINVVLPLFLIMCLGTFLRKIKIFDEKFLRTANSFTFKVLLPALLFNNIYKSDISDTFNPKLVIFAVSTVLIIILLLVITVPKFEKNNKNRGVLIQAMFRSNYVLFGIPLCTNIFGESSTGITSMLIAVIVPLYNFMSVIILDIYSKEEIRIGETLGDVARNPLILASLTGIAVSVLNIKLPVAFDRTISDIAKIATPLALMILGGEFEISNVYKNIKYIVTSSLVKLVLVPSVVIPAAVMAGFRGVELGTLFSMVSAPVAVSSFTMAQHCDANYELAGQIVFITTILSSLTIFMFIYILKSLCLF